MTSLQSCLAILACIGIIWNHWTLCVLAFAEVRPTSLLPRQLPMHGSASTRLFVSVQEESPVSGSPVSSPLQDPGTAAFPQQPPHAGCHFYPTHPAYNNNPTRNHEGSGARVLSHPGPRKSQRFFEGWYYRLTIPPSSSCPNGASFAFIVSIEDPLFGNKQKVEDYGDEHEIYIHNQYSQSSSSPPPPGSSPLALSCHQVMGPDDDYLVQADRDHTKFWAWYHQQALGCIFETKTDPTSTTSTTALPPEIFDETVKSGFQFLPTTWQGKLVGHDGSLGGVLKGQGVPGECFYNFSIQEEDEEEDSIAAGWGDETVGQKSTAGWLASYQVFEPHWQVTIADARATGTVIWKGKEYNFKNAPFYAEKNWGGAFPTKWYWCQCNAFQGYTNIDNGEKTLSVTAGGGTRKIPLGQKESLGMISVHYNGMFYEATPWLGSMEWDISPWGYWKMTGRSTKGVRPFEVSLEATCDSPGVKLRAPTQKDGMVYFCRDSFQAEVTLSLWELEWDESRGEYVRGARIVDQAKSTQAAVELGGGPWWDHWRAASKMKQPMRGLVRLPYRLAALKNRLAARRQERRVFRQEARAKRRNQSQQ